MDKTTGIYPSFPTLSSTITTPKSDIDIELNTKSFTDKSPTEDQVAVRGSKKLPSLTVRQRLDCLHCWRSLVYFLVFAAVWVFNALPTLVFFTLESQVSNSSDSLGPGAGIENSSDSLESGTGETTTVQLNCSSDFFLDKGTGLCRPDCGEWNQYSLWRERAVYGVDSSFTALAVLIDTITLVVSCVRYKIMFSFPNILIIYITIARLLVAIIHLIAHFDEDALYCTSRDLITSYEEGSPFCNFTGIVATYFQPVQLILASFHLGVVIFAIYFPFKYRHFEAKHRFKYIHIAAVVSAILVPAPNIGIQYALGGYSRTLVPLFCLSNRSSAFFFAVIPASLASAIFLSLVMLLFFKIVCIANWNSCNRKQRPEDGDGDNSKAKSTYTEAQIKLVFTFLTYSLFSVIGYVLYSVVLNRQGIYSTELERYFDCESTGTSPDKVCSRESFENLDPSKFSLTTTTILLVGWPLATLIYVTNFEKIISKVKQKCMC